MFYLPKLGTLDLGRALEGQGTWACIPLLGIFVKTLKKLLPNFKMEFFDQNSNKSVQK